MSAPTAQLSAYALARRSLRHYWAANLALVLGVAAATAVLVGSLIVGDSVKASLRNLALERLGKTEQALTCHAFCREQLARDLVEAGAAGQCAAAILLEGAARPAAAKTTVPRVNVIGCDDGFWRLFDRAPPPQLAGRRAALNEQLARDLGVGVGDAILLTVGRPARAPADTAFRHRSRERVVRSMRLVVADILPNRGAGIFTLRNDQARPRNAYVALPWLQRQLKREGQANVVLAAKGDDAALGKALRLEDFGLRLSANARRGLVVLHGGRLVLRPAVVQAARAAAHAAGLQYNAASVYLANSLRVVHRGASNAAAPYSVVAGVDAAAPAPFGPFTLTDGRRAPALGPDQMLLNEWAGDDLGARVGDAIEMTYYVAGDRGEMTTASREFKLAGIVAMRGPALDRSIAPDFEGITDAKTMQDWDPPFPIDMRRIRPKDEAYWKRYRTTPKAFIALAAARRLWRPADEDSPWVTAVRVAPMSSQPLVDVASAFEQALMPRLPRAAFGLTFRPVKREALDAAKGSTDFGVLFLSMSMFLVASAAGLVALLLRLSIERRASQYGIMLATGFTRARAARTLAAEAAALTVFGLVFGALFGVGYAWFIIYALAHWWSGAVGDFAFSLHVAPATVIGGCAAGFAVSWCSIKWAARLLRRTRLLGLLAGWRALAARPSDTVARRARALAWAAFGLVAALLVLSGALGVVSATAAFFLIGAALLVGQLAFAAARLWRPGAARVLRPPTAWRLAWQSASRNALRSLLTMGLVACAAFIIVTVAANRTDLSRLDTRDRSSGAGGFNLMARSDLPVLQDLNSPAGRRELGFSVQADAALAKAKVVPLRVRDGDDVSCLNIQRPTTPRVLGAPSELIERGGFRFAKVLWPNETNPWRLLDRDLPPADGSPVVPAFADAASAQWILHKGLGDYIEVPGRDGRPVRLRLVGLLSKSVFASEVIISEAQFRRCFGADSGYRLFLIEANDEPGVTAALRASLADFGIDVTRTADQLAAFARVQNTYLSTFQTLGGLGLLLGTFGVVTVLLRGVVERRGELAMMLALGFQRRWLVAIIILENGLLLLCGVAVGTIAALVAVAPHLASTQAHVRWASLMATLAACVIAGLAACAVAAVAAVRGDLVTALRSE